MGTAALIIGVVLLLCFANRGQGTIIRQCHSKDCKHNRNGRCSLKDIDVYDNGVQGICLWHTNAMMVRIADALKKGAEVGKKDGEIQAIEKFEKIIDKKSEDIKAIKNPKEFERWMLRHGMK